MGLTIIDHARALPAKWVENAYFETYLDTSDEWIKTRTGIRGRYFVEEEDVSDLTLACASKLSIPDPRKIVLAIVASFTSDSVMPSLASLLQEPLGLSEICMTFDVNVACSGFVTALQVAHSMLELGEQAIVIGAEAISRVMDHQDRATAILFGDGAGGVVVEKNEQPMAFVGGTRTSKTDLSLQRGGVLEMQGKNVYRFALEIVPKCIENVLVKNHLAKDEVDLVICHQANQRIIQAVAERTDIPLEKFYVNLDRYGNTSAASIPIALDEVLTQRQPKNIVLVGFGGGLTWSSTVIRMEE